MATFRNKVPAISLSPAAQVLNQYTLKYRTRDGVHMIKGVECASVYDLVNAAARGYRDTSGLKRIFE